MYWTERKKEKTEGENTSICRIGRQGSFICLHEKYKEDLFSNLSPLNEFSSVGWLATCEIAMFIAWQIFGLDFLVLLGWQQKCIRDDSHNNIRRNGKLKKVLYQSKVTMTLIMSWDWLKLMTLETQLNSWLITLSFLMHPKSFFYRVFSVIGLYVSTYDQRFLPRFVTDSFLDRPRLFYSPFTVM